MGILVMTSWKNDYIAALKERDKKEKANQKLYNYYSRLADRTARFSNISASEAAKASSHDKGAEDETKAPSALNPKVAKLQEDLAEAQRSRARLQSRLNDVMEELAKAQSTGKDDKKRLGQLTQERQTLITKLRDRDEELRGKTKLLEDVHDETVSLTLQLNMAESQTQKLREENSDLVDRWMARMGQEADAMNLASRFS